MSVTKKKVSKKHKSSWRKYINIKDVEEFLEQKREEERIGLVSEKTNEELFTLDTNSNKNLLTPKQKRKLNALKPPKNISILENTSKVEDPLVQRDHVKLKRNGRNLIQEILNPKKTRRVIQSIGDRAKYYQKLDKTRARNKIAREFKDAWEEEDDPIKKKFLNNEWINKNLALHHLKNIGKPLVKIHQSAHHKTSRAKALEIPHPGMSYNPSLKDHQDLLQKVIDRETKIIKEEKHLKRVTKDMFSKVTEDERDSSWRMEMSNGLDEENGTFKPEVDEPDENDSDSSLVYRTINPPVEIKKKDKKARRKQREQREIQKKLQKKKEEKKKATDVHRLKYLVTDVLNKITETEKLQKRRKAINEKKKYEPKRISKMKYQEPDIDINMAEEISGNLRNIKLTQTSLLVDRFKNFQARNILPTNVDLGPRKRRKIKRFVNKSHKELPEQLKKLEMQN